RHSASREWPLLFLGRAALVARTSGPTSGRVTEPVCTSARSPATWKPYALPVHPWSKQQVRARLEDAYAEAGTRVFACAPALFDFGEVSETCTPSGEAAQSFGQVSISLIWTRSEHRSSWWPTPTRKNGRDRVTRDLLGRAPSKTRSK